MNNINAKDCCVKDIDKEIADNFLIENNKQQKAKYFLCYGLYYKDELVQIIAFGKPRFNKYYSWEIIRDCTKTGYNIQGGTCKLWNYFIDNNTVKNCICYSYPDRISNLYTNKYIDFCGFTNIKEARPTKKIYYEGIWNGELKRIDKSILVQHGVDRLLNGDFGKDKTNEQILLDLGFERKEEDGFEPQVDSYFTGGLVYKITDIDTGKFYIGETTNLEDFHKRKYNGSCGDWSEYFDKYDGIHEFKREILRNNFKTPKELYEFEINEILKYCIRLKNGNYQVDESTGCMNRKTTIQPEMPVCPECGAVLFHHKKTCSKYKQPTACEECGSIGSLHYNWCSKFKDSEICPECGGKNKKHYKWCSQYTSRSVCPECGSMTSHLKTCSKYKTPEKCEECGGIQGKHKKACSKYNTGNPCLECRGIRGNHLKTCSKYKKRTPCEFCGSLTTHKKDCPKYKGQKLVLSVEQQMNVIKNIVLNSILRINVVNAVGCIDTRIHVRSIKSKFVMNVVPSKECIIKTVQSIKKQIEKPVLNVVA